MSYRRGTNQGLRVIGGRTPQAFDRVQWWMNAPVFEAKRHYNLDRKMYLPYIALPDNEDSVRSKQVGYSEVFAVKIHPAHNTFWAHSTTQVLQPPHYHTLWLTDSRRASR